MNIRVGRFISLPDIEAQLAPDNYMFSHSLLYGYDPYTQIGTVASIKLNKEWTVVGLTAGNDTAPWIPTRGLSPLACLQWISAGNSDSIYGCANTINGAQWTYNNVNHWSRPGAIVVQPDPQHADRVLVHVGEGRAALQRDHQHAGRYLPAVRLRAKTRRHPRMGHSELSQLAVGTQGSVRRAASTSTTPMASAPALPRATGVSASAGRTSSSRTSSSGRSWFTTRRWTSRPSPRAPSSPRPLRRWI